MSSENPEGGQDETAGNKNAQKRETGQFGNP